MVETKYVCNFVLGALCVQCKEILELCDTCRYCTRSHASGTIALVTSAPGCRLQFRFDRDVSRLLRQRGVAHQREARTADGMFSVDLALPGAARPRS